MKTFMEAMTDISRLIYEGGKEVLENYRKVVNKEMKTSDRGIALIKEFEGLRLDAYKAVSTEKYYTIGYGHYGADVKKGMHITEKQAEQFLRSDLQRFEKAVNAIGKPFNQNQFDALVSFTYNCGEGNLKKLTSGRDIATIGNKLILYNKSGGKVLKGLQRRREKEQALYFS